MRITTATVAIPVGTPDATAQKGNSTAVNAVAEAEAPWRSRSQFITHSTTLLNALSAGAPGAPAARAMPAAGTAGGGGGVTASALSTSDTPSPGSAHATSLSSASERTALKNQLTAAVALKAARRSSAAGRPSSGQRSIRSCTRPAAEILRCISDATTTDLSARALNVCTAAETLRRVFDGASHGASRATDIGRGASAAAFEGVWESSPFVSSSSASSGAGCAKRAKAAHGARRSPATHRSCNSVITGQPQLLMSLTQDNRGFLNPGYSCDSSDRNSDDCDYSSVRGGSDGGAAGKGRHGATSAASSGRAAPVPVVASSLRSGEKRSVLALFPLAAAEEEAARQVYDAYRTQQQKTCNHRNDASFTRRHSQITKTASPSSLSRSTSVGENELLQLLRRLYDRAQGMMVPSTRAAAFGLAPPLARAPSPTTAANVVGVRHRFPSNKYLLDMAEACFGTRRFQALMAAATADGDGGVTVVARNRGAPAHTTASQSRWSSSPGLTVGEALSFFRCLKTELPSNALKQAKPRHGGQPARPGATAGNTGQDRSAEAFSSLSALDLPSSQRRRSASATISHAAQDVCRRRSTPAARRHSRPPPSSIACVVARRATAALIRPRKPRGRRKSPRRRTGLPPPPFQHLLISDSCKSDAAHRDDLIRTYVQQRAFAEIAEGHGGQDSSTVTLEWLMKVLRWFKLALNPSAVERVCGVRMQSARESHISIDFNAFVKIISSGLHGQCCSEGSCSSFALTHVSADNNSDPPLDMPVLALLPEMPIRAPSVLPVIPGPTAAEAASLGAGRGAVPCASAAYCTGSVRYGEGPNRSLLAAASAASAVHCRQSSVSSVTTSASSAASGTSVHRPSLDTDDAYPFVAHHSAIAVLCRSIRQRLRRELRMSVSSGSDALLPPRDDQSSSSWDDGVAPKERDHLRHFPLAQRMPTVSYSSRSSSLASAAAMSMPSGDVGAACLFRESGSVSTSHHSEECATPPLSSKRRIGTTYNTQRFCQTLREQASQSPVVAPVLPPRLHPYTLAPALRDMLAEPDVIGEEAIVSKHSPSTRRWRGRGYHLNGLPPAVPATARRRSPSSAAAGRCRQQQGSAHLLTSLSPYCNSGQNARGTGGHRRLRSAAQSMLSRIRRSPSLHSCPDQSLLHTLPSAEPNSSASFLFQPLPARMASRRPKLNRSGSSYMRPVAVPALGVCAAHVSQAPFFAIRQIVAAAVVARVSLSHSGRK
ncbi:hypothetical protein GH5_00222 [Leishmania sp. Ghana 2012 LV757]|uniref:hypothetical protein n=1 Tax=Leishmania sp. Ghana 2012 LV757 TaxID=2803181 RepID=UPI001B4C6D38|nr:hypothetical protein GH5_00222 [Leishmania sp. Ghana 2012 LV757]